MHKPYKFRCLVERDAKQYQVDIHVCARNLPNAIRRVGRKVPGLVKVVSAVRS